MADSLENEKHGLLFSVRRSVRYHMRLRRFYEVWTAGSSILVLIAGSGAFVLTVAPALPGLLPVMTALAAVSAALNLAVGPLKNASLHASLAQQFIYLEIQIVHATPISEEQLRDLTAQRLKIEADEPPIRRLLDAMCHYELKIALGYDEPPPVVPLWRRVMMHFVSQPTFAQSLRETP